MLKLNLGKKRCTKCGKEKSLKCFPFDKQKRDGYYSSCRLCHRIWYKEHPNKKLMNTKRKLQIYGLTLEDYEIMCKLQNNKCAICGRENKNGWRLGVDHNHKTGQVRGLLCASCNVVVGTSYENIDILKSVIRYLIKYNG